MAFNSQSHNQHSRPRAVEEEEMRGPLLLVWPTPFPFLWLCCASCNANGGACQWKGGEGTAEGLIFPLPSTWPLPIFHGRRAWGRQLLVVVVESKRWAGVTAGWWASFLLFHGCVSMTPTVTPIFWC